VRALPTVTRTREGSFPDGDGKEAPRIDGTPAATQWRDPCTESRPAIPGRAAAGSTSRHGGHITLRPVWRGEQRYAATCLGG